MHEHFGNDGSDSNDADDMTKSIYTVTIRSAQSSSTANQSLRRPPQAGTGERLPVGLATFHKSVLASLRHRKAEQVPPVPVRTSLTERSRVILYHYSKTGITPMRLPNSQ